MLVHKFYFILGDSVVKNKQSTQSLETNISKTNGVKLCPEFRAFKLKVSHHAEEKRVTKTDHVLAS